MKWIMLALLLTLLGIGNALSQEPEPVPFGQLLKGWNQTIQSAREALEDDFARVEAAQVKSDLQATLASVREARGQATAQLESAKQLLQSLAPSQPSPLADKESNDPATAEAPTAPAETPQIAALRKKMQERVAEFNSQVSQTNLIISQANDLLGSIARWEQVRFRSEILKRSPPPFYPEIWQKAGADALAFAKSAIEAPHTWWNTHREQKSAWQLLVPLLVVLLLGLVIGWPTRIWLMRRFGRDAAEPEPTYARRIIAAVADGFANAVIPAAIVALTLLVLYLRGVLTGLFALLFYSGGVALAAFLMIMGLTRAAASPHLVAWRIAPVQPAHVYRLLQAIRGTTASLLIAFALLLTAYYCKMLTPELESAFFIVQVPLTSLLIVWALTPTYWETSLADSQSAGSVEQAAESTESEESEEPSATGDEEETTGKGPSPRSWFDYGRKTIRVIMLLVPFLALAGYGRLAFYIQSRLVAAAILIGFVVLVRLAIVEMAEHWVTRQRLMATGAARKTDEANQRKIRGTMFWIGMAVDLLIIPPLIYLLLLTFGVPVTTLQLWTGQLLSGIQVGSISISLGAMLLAILVLILGVVITNLIRHWLANRVLPNTRLDIGARNSIASATSYLGVAVALLIAISTLGVDFSSLALVAGALSVGIGFGLQNVVQNFVAGLLMLIERPIKVGDWVIVGATQGTVKRIAVRATEIETFDRSSVFVPNSEFIASPVTNWTYKNRLARLIIPVRVAHGSDTKAVAAILLRCAKTHRCILRYPPPAAYFLAFGDFSLNFELRCYVYDTDYYLSAISDLHFAIDDAFRQEGIEIPVPQHDLHLRSGNFALSPEQQNAKEITGERHVNKRG